MGERLEGGKGFEHTHEVVPMEQTIMAYRSEDRLRQDDPPSPAASLLLPAGEKFVDGKNFCW